MQEAVVLNVRANTTHGIRIHPSISNVPFQRNTLTQQRPSSRTYTRAAIVTNDTSASTSFTETAPTTDSSSNLITTNCAPLFNGTRNDFSNDFQHHLTTADDKSPHNDASKANGISNEPLGTRPIRRELQITRSSLRPPKLLLLPATKRPTQLFFSTKDPNAATCVKVSLTN